MSALKSSVLINLQSYGPGTVSECDNGVCFLPWGLPSYPGVESSHGWGRTIPNAVIMKPNWGGGNHWTVLRFPPKMVSFIISWSLEERPLELFWMRSWMRFWRRPCRWFVEVEMKSILLFHCQVREDMDLWREKGAEEEREKVKMEGEIQEMQQKKMVTEEEKRRYFTFSLFSSHMKRIACHYLLQVSWKAGEGHQHAAGL